MGLFKRGWRFFFQRIGLLSKGIEILVRCDLRFFNLFDHLLNILPNGNHGSRQVLGHPLHGPHIGDGLLYLCAGALRRLRQIRGCCMGLLQGGRST